MAWIGVLIPVVTIVAVFTFVAVVSWSDNRLKEREAYYRHETFRRLLDEPGGSSQAVMDLMRQEDRSRRLKRIEGLKLGGMITTAAGIGIAVFLYALEPTEALYLVGLIPLLVGLVLLIYAFLMPPREEA